MPENPAPGLLCAMALRRAHPCEGHRRETTRAPAHEAGDSAETKAHPGTGQTRVQSWRPPWTHWMQSWE